MIGHCLSLPVDEWLRASRASPHTVSSSHLHPLLAPVCYVLSHVHHHWFTSLPAYPSAPVIIPCLSVCPHTPPPSPSVPPPHLLRLLVAKSAG